MTRALAVLAIAVPAVLIWTLGHFTGGLIVGGVALAVICWYGYRAWTADRERRRRYRELVWQRRLGSVYFDIIPNITTERTIRPARAFTVIKGGKEKGTHP